MHTLVTERARVPIRVSIAAKIRWKQTLETEVLPMCDLKTTACFQTDPESLVHLKGETWLFWTLVGSLLHQTLVKKGSNFVDKLQIWRLPESLEKRVTELIFKWLCAVSSERRLVSESVFSCLKRAYSCCFTVWVASSLLRLSFIYSFQKLRLTPPVKKGLNGRCKVQVLLFFCMGNLACKHVKNMQMERSIRKI